MKRSHAIGVLILLLVVVAVWGLMTRTRKSPDIDMVTRKVGRVMGSDVYSVEYLLNGVPLSRATVIDMGEWAVIAQKNGESWNVSIGFDFARENADDVLAELNRQFAMKLFPDDNKPIYVTVIFSKPIPFDEFRRIVQESGMNVVRYEVRGYEENGQPVTIGGSPSGDTLVLKGKINEFRESAAARGHPFVVAGIISADGYLTRNGYDVLIRSGTVRMVNVLRVLAKQIAKDYLGIDVAAEDIMGPMPYVSPSSR